MRLPRPYELELDPINEDDLREVEHSLDDLRHESDERSRPLSRFERMGRRYGSGSGVRIGTSLGRFEMAGRRRASESCIATFSSSGRGDSGGVWSPATAFPFNSTAIPLQESTCTDSSKSSSRPRQSPPSCSMSPSRGFDEFSRESALGRSVRALAARFLLHGRYPFRCFLVYLAHSRSDAKEANVKKTARAELSSVKGTSIPILRSSSQASTV